MRVRHAGFAGELRQETTKGWGVLRLRGHGATLVLRLCLESGVDDYPDWCSVLYDFFSRPRDAQVYGGVASNGPCWARHGGTKEQAAACLLLVAKDVAKQARNVLRTHGDLAAEYAARVSCEGAKPVAGYDRYDVATHWLACHGLRTRQALVRELLHV